MAAFLQTTKSTPSYLIAASSRDYISKRGIGGGANFSNRLALNIQALEGNCSSSLSRSRLAIHISTGRNKDRQQGCGPGICSAVYGHSATGDDKSSPAPHLCLFPLQSACLPTATGQLLVHEPRYVQMFEVVMEVARAEMNVAQFGMFHNLRLLDELSPAAFNHSSPNNIHIGSCCHVESISDSVGDGLMVTYKCVGRFMVNDIKINHPFYVAHVDWVTDFPPDLPGISNSGAARDRLEREVWQALNDVAALTVKLDKSRVKQEEYGEARFYSQEWLPAEVRHFAPMSPWAPPYPAPNRQVAADIAIWRRSSNNSGGHRSSIAQMEQDQLTKNNSNPYWSAREKLIKPLRQEAFSFAAASIVEAGVQERNALLKTRDTSARLTWILDAVQPYLKQLRAENSVLEALESMS